MVHRKSLLLLLVTLTITWGLASGLYGVYIYYSGNSCAGTPYNAYTVSDFDCEIEECISDGNATASRVGMASIDCTSDYKTSVRNAFGTSPFILVEVYGDSECETLSYAQSFFASGNCEGSPNLNSSEAARVIARLEADGSATLEYYRDDTCEASGYSATYSADKNSLRTHNCDENWCKWYYIDGDDAADTDDQASSGPANDIASNQSSNTPIIAAVSIVGVLILLVIAGCVWCCKRRSNRKRTETVQQPTASLQSGNTASLEAALRGQIGLWDDDVITANRIPRDKVQVKEVISHGAFGEVCQGVFNGKPVAVKMLLPHMRGNIQQVNDFLAEAKMTATMDHPHIVRFVGVAWDSLSDLCVVLEFMDGGDLRGLLNKYQSTNHRVGFDREKTTIALQVCHALTYLHSLMPPVIHRDLKSRNILLSRAMEAKLTDFGISRERQDQTMTAGVGTSLWMAPEVMLGERYDIKADMFSFGVVLSELDVHTLPYAKAKEQARDSNGRTLPDAAILQQVTMGNLHVEFSQVSPKGIVELGRACTSLNSSDRPTAAEALYRLQMVLTKENM